MSSSHTHWGPLRSLLVLSPILIVAPWIAFTQHFSLPEPLTDLVDPVTNLSQISESRILGFAKYLSEEIGFRTVGTSEHALADRYMVQQAEEAQKHCERVVAESGRKLECEVWRQEGSGSHRFDMMNKRLYKTYVNLTNIIIRISDGTPEGKEHAVLVNAHLDSTLPSPGAADDAISVGVMLDCMRVLVDTPGWSPKHAIILLFNHAEESLQDGSHLYSTQHPTASTVRAVINLEAAGTTGRELLFQATSQQMIEAYFHVPRPFGAVFANDVFSSGIILSDTDFRQFEEYLNVTGLDMAIVGNSYLYHMRKDLVENIEAGVAQNMGENTLALMRFLSAEGSPLPSLIEGYTPPSTVFFSHFGHFFIYSFATAKIMYSALLLGAALLVELTFVDPAPAMKKGNGVWVEQARGAAAVVSGLLCTLLVPNLVALVMRFGLNKGMSWFASPFAPIGLYGPPAVLGALLSQYLIPDVRESSVFSATILLQCFLAVAVQLMNIGSAGLFFLSGLPLCIAFAFNWLYVGNNKDLSLWTYALGQFLPLSTGTLVMLPISEVFVPLTGRIGGEAPADSIIATIVAAVGSLALPLLLPFARRFGLRSLRKGITLMTILTVVAMALFAMKEPFDDMHQKRMFVLHIENIVTNEQHMHIAAADGAPGFESLVNDIVKEFVTADVQPLPLVMDNRNPDWDGLYPFSTFLKAYKVPLSVDPEYVSPWLHETKFNVVAVNETRDLASETRTLTIQVSHPGLIWTVIAFDAHVLKWTLDNNPPNENARHFIREASFYGIDTWSVDLTIKLTPDTMDDGLHVNFIGLQEKGVWPAKKAFKSEGGVAMQLFEELDEWLDKKTAGTVDPLLMGCVAGEAIV